ncbi:MAG: DegT/DnrJ/EryC1/StrS family aminotransferase, partial [Thermoguttaceae bacterium]|nr:DegT/DnrJ/EryC1/StrS family aminotransferase [Thermoguttaceae bacterium]
MQISKNLCGGVGGVVLTDDEFLAYKVLDAHTHGFLPHSGRSLDEYRPVRASNYRMTGFQGAILSAQLPHIAAQADVRNENALYLSSLLRDIPGVYPQRIYDGGRSAWHLYMFRIDEE